MTVKESIEKEISRAEQEKEAYKQLLLTLSATQSLMRQMCALIVPFKEMTLSATRNKDKQIDLLNADLIGAVENGTAEEEEEDF